MPAAGGVLLLPLRERRAAVVRLGCPGALRSTRRQGAVAHSGGARDPDRRTRGFPRHCSPPHPAGVDGCCRSPAGCAAGTPKYVHSPPLLRRTGATSHLSTVPGTRPGFVLRAALGGALPCAPLGKDAVTSNRTWPFGAVWGASVATVATVLLVAGSVLAPADVNGPPLPRLLLAWWIATPLCGSLAASRVDLFRRRPTAMAWGVVCAVPWVVSIMVGARGVLPSSTSDWAGIFARALALGACAGIMVWRTLRDRCPAPPGHRRWRQHEALRRRRRGCSR
jgi:hypothetical protein